MTEQKSIVHYMAYHTDYRGFLFSFGSSMKSSSFTLSEVLGESPDLEKSGVSGRTAYLVFSATHGQRKLNTQRNAQLAWAKGSSD